MKDVVNTETVEKPELVQLNFRVRPALKRAMRMAAAQQGVSVQDLGEQVVRMYFGIADSEIEQRRLRAVQLLMKTAEENGDPILAKWCALQGSNLRPLPCEGNAPAKESKVVIRLTSNGLHPFPSVLPLHSPANFFRLNLPVAA